MQLVVCSWLCAAGCVQLIVCSWLCAAGWLQLVVGVVGVVDVVDYVDILAFTKRFLSVYMLLMIGLC